MCAGPWSTAGPLSLSSGCRLLINWSAVGSASPAAVFLGLRVAIVYFSSPCSGKRCGREW